MLNLEQLTDPERQLWDAIEPGQQVDLQGGTSSDHDLSKGSDWGAQHTIRASVLIEMLTSPSLPSGREARAIRLCDARITGMLDLESRKVLCPLDFTHCYFGEPIQLREAETRRIVLSDCQFPALEASQLITHGNLVLVESTTKTVSIPEARIRGRFSLDYIQIDNPHGTALCADNAVIDGEMHGAHIKIHGELRMIGTHIGGQLNLPGAQLNNPNGRVLSADGAQIDGGVFSKGIETHGELRMTGAHVGGQLIFHEGRLSNPNGQALSADGAQIDGGVFSEGIETHGELRMLGAQIGAQLILVDAKLNCPNNHAFSADGAQIDGDVFGHGLQVDGELRMPGARIGGQLVLAGAKLKNQAGKVLNLTRSQIAESVHCSGGFAAHGEITMPGAHIGGQLILDDAQLTNPTGLALSADNCQIDTDVIFGRATVKGELRMRGAHIDGQLSLSDATLSNPIGLALDLERAYIQHATLTMATQPDGTLDLTDCRMGRLDDLWPTTRYKACLNGLVYESLKPLPNEVSTRLDWLSNAADGYLPQPYQQLEAILRRAGRDDAARRVAIAKERRRRGELNRLGRAWNRILDATVGYGYQIWKGLLWFIGVAIVGGAVFAWAKANHHMTALSERNEPLPQFHAFLYSLDSVLPVVNLGQKEYWSPTGFAQYWH